MAYRIRNAQHHVVAEVDTMKEAADVAGLGVYEVGDQLATYGVAAVGCLRVEVIPSGTSVES